LVCFKKSFAFSIRRLRISIRIEGGARIFNYVGVVEDVTEIILESKQVRFKRQIEDIDNESVTISISGKGNLLLVIFKIYFWISVLNPDLNNCNLDSKVNFNMELTIEKVEVTFLRRKQKAKRSYRYNIYRFYFTPKKCKIIENFRVEQKNRLRKVSF
jgi:DNA-directed RNA polymerase subunit alpha